MDEVRLSKLLAQRGLCSRREAEAYIERGWVLVDGAPVCRLGVKVRPDQEISLAPEATTRQSARVTVLLNKPVGYVSGQAEKGYKPAIVLVRPETRFRADTSGIRFHESHLHGLAVAGRLDIDSQGLLVLTQDGRVAKRLIGENRVDKEYLVRVRGALSAESLALLNHGLCLDGRLLKPAQVAWLNEDQLRFILHEGRKRQIRRMCELVGLSVIGLKRVRIGKIQLGNLPEGQWRYLGPDEAF
jgi:23S rRNA pseudouridine2604 synthase